MPTLLAMPYSGGPVGFAAALGNAMVKQVAGKDVGELALALFDSEAEVLAIISPGAANRDRTQ